MSEGADVAADLLTIWGGNSIDEDEDRDEPSKSSFNDETAPGVCNALVEWLERVVEEVEWMHDNMKVEMESRNQYEDKDDDDDDEDAAYTAAGTQQGPQNKRALLQNEVYERMLGVIEAIRPLVSSAIPISGKLRVNTARLTIRAYKLLRVMLMQAISHHRMRKKKAKDKKTDIPLLRTKAFELIGLVLQEFSPSVFNFISFIHDESTGEATNDNGSKKASSNTTAELKAIPELVHEVEAFDGLVIQASKLLGGDKKGSKGRILLKKMHRTVSNQFRIDKKQLEKSLDLQDEARTKRQEKEKSRNVTKTEDPEEEGEQTQMDPELSPQREGRAEFEGGPGPYEQSETW